MPKTLSDHALQVFCARDRVIPTVARASVLHFATKRL
jgi:hypothetical protein